MEAKCVGKLQATFLMWRLTRYSYLWAKSKIFLSNVRAKRLGLVSRGTWLWESIRINRFTWCRCSMRIPYMPSNAHWWNLAIARTATRLRTSLSRIVKLVNNYALSSSKNFNNSKKAKNQVCSGNNKSSKSLNACNKRTMKKLQSFTIYRTR